MQYKRKLTPDGRAKRAKPVVQIDMEGNVVRRYDSIQQAADHLDTHISSICKVLKHKRGSIYGFTFKYEY